MIRSTLAAALVVMISQAAQASLVVTVGDATLLTGSTGTVDVMIASDTPSGDLLSFLGFEFRITTGGPTRLDFVDPQSDFQLTDPNYLFAGDSLAAAFPPVGLVSTTIVPNDTIIGGDATFSGNEINVGATPLLLARLEFTASIALPPIPGDTFTIDLESSVLTFFQDNTFTDLSFSSTSGTVTIVIPEPSSAMLAIVALTAIAPTAIRRGRVLRR